MAARGRGAVINVLTMVAHFGVAGMTLYGSSKAALTLLTKAWVCRRAVPRPLTRSGSAS
jgi:NAD(P)-dependent dehydrogenase (short-subunit alcohol dehydrogenase family)